MSPFESFSYLVRVDLHSVRVFCAVLRLYVFSAPLNFQNMLGEQLVLMNALLEYTLVFFPNYSIILQRKYAHWVVESTLQNNLAFSKKVIKWFPYNKLLELQSSQYYDLNISLKTPLVACPPWGVNRQYHLAISSPITLDTPIVQQNEHIGLQIASFFCVFAYAIIASVASSP